MIGIVKSTFKRERPKSHYKQDGLPEGWFAIRHDHFSEKKQRRDAHGRWFKISGIHSSIYRVPGFANRLPKNKILLDWEGWLNLNGRQENVDDSLELTTPQFVIPASGAMHSIAERRRESGMICRREAAMPACASGSHILRRIPEQRS